MDPAIFPNLAKYAEYVKKYEAVDKKALDRELRELEASLMRSSADSQDQRVLYDLDRDLSVMRELFSVSLVKDQYDYYAADRSRFGVKRFIDFFREKGPGYGLYFDFDGDVAKLDSCRERMERFYDHALKRDEAFIRNIESRLKKDGKGVAILVTGGFHGGNLSKLFRDKGYSYVQIMPALEAEEDCPYFRLLSGGKSGIETMVEANISGIAIQSIFSEMGVPEKRIFELGVEVATRLVEKGRVTLLMPYGYTTLVYGDENLAELDASAWAVGVSGTGEKLAKEVGRIGERPVYAVRVKYEKRAGAADDARVPGAARFDLAEAVRVLLPGQALEGATTSYGGKLTIKGHESGDTMLTLAHDPGYEALEAHDMSRLIRSGSVIWQDLKKELSGMGLGDYLEELESLLGGERAEGIVWLVTGRDMTPVPWIFHHRALRKRRVHLSFYGSGKKADSGRLATGFIHELGALAGRPHEENSRIMRQPQKHMEGLLAALECILKPDPGRLAAPDGYMANGEGSSGDRQVSQNAGPGRKSTDQCIRSSLLDTFPELPDLMDDQQLAELVNAARESLKNDYGLSDEEIIHMDPGKESLDRAMSVGDPAKASVLLGCWIEAEAYPTLIIFRNSRGEVVYVADRVLAGLNALLQKEGGLGRKRGLAILDIARKASLYLGRDGDETWLPGMVRTLRSMYRLKDELSVFVDDAKGDIFDIISFSIEIFPHKPVCQILALLSDIAGDPAPGEDDGDAGARFGLVDLLIHPEGANAAFKEIVRNIVEKENQATYSAFWKDYESTSFESSGLQDERSEYPDYSKEALKFLDELGSEDPSEEGDRNDVPGVEDDNNDVLDWDVTGGTAVACAARKTPPRNENPIASDSRSASSEKNSPQKNEGPDQWEKDFLPLEELDLGSSSDSGSAAPGDEQKRDARNVSIQFPDEGFLRRFDLPEDPHEANTARDRNDTILKDIVERYGDGLGVSLQPGSRLRRKENAAALSRLKKLKLLPFYRSMFSDGKDKSCETVADVLCLLTDEQALWILNRIELFVQMFLRARFESPDDMRNALSERGAGTKEAAVLIGVLAKAAVSREAFGLISDEARREIQKNIDDLKRYLVGRLTEPELRQYLAAFPVQKCVASRDGYKVDRVALFRIREEERRLKSVYRPTGLLAFHDLRECYVSLGDECFVLKMESRAGDLQSEEYFLSLYFVTQNTKNMITLVDHVSLGSDRDAAEKTFGAFNSKDGVLVLLEGEDAEKTIKAADAFMAEEPAEVIAPKIASSRVSVRRVGDNTTINVPGLEALTLKAAGDKTADQNNAAWDEYMDLCGELDREIVETCCKNLFDGKEGLIAIGLNSKAAKTFQAILMKHGIKVRNEAADLIREYKLGNITIRFFDDRSDEEIRETIGRIKAIEKGKTRSIVFSSRRQDGARIKSLEENSYVVYLDSADGERITPIEGAVMGGLAYLERSNYEEKAEKEKDYAKYKDVINAATQKFARRLALMAGAPDHSKFLSAITTEEDGVLKLIASGEILVMIRPVDLSELRRYYEAETRILMSL